MKLHDLSKPSGKERRGTRDKQVKHRRALRNPATIRKSIQRQADHIEGELEKRGQKPTFDELSDFRRFLKGAIAAVQPFEADGSHRPEGSMDVFLRVSELFIRACAVLMPYERPRLAAIMYRHENDRDDEPEQYETVWQMRDALIKNGIPIDHLDGGPKLIEHLDAGADQEPDAGNK